MSIDFMMWKDEYETLRHKYDDVIGRMERGAEKLGQIARMADQFSVQARTLRQGVIPTRDTNRELSHFLGVIEQYLRRFGCYY
ncbi:glial fibrillary acidic protein-like [Cucumis melo var. makuwa]|uniref:Glial fibrillary acidic protein-like n=1 Tax=Cucumis melo var. makuwa TaxID=1194695 RepID=A0A5D3C1I3_CUCMM|nr:glial fibrillary acidic protein-like [Cucumis melo var. makuwa]